MTAAHVGRLGAAALVGAAHAVGLGLVALMLGHRFPGPITVAGLFLAGAVAAYALLAGRLRMPAVLLGLALVAATVLEVVTPGPWVTAMGTDRLTVGVPVLRSYTEAASLLLAVVVLGALAEAAFRARTTTWRALRDGVLAALALPVAVGLAGLARSGTWPPSFLLGGVALAFTALGATALLRRTRLVAPWLVLLAAVTVATVASWVTDPRTTDPAVGLIAAAPMWTALALLLGLVESLARGVIRLLRRRRRSSGAGVARAAVSTG